MNSLDNTGNREIRIFLSSTFSDMQEERNYLTKKIFPRITEICEKRQIRFSVLDLRWGITEEESRTGKVIEICMDEIKRTKPYFIGLLGGRYGWIPTEEETVRNRHLTEKYPWIPEYMKAGCSITEIEMQFAALKETENIEAFFFLRDMDSVPARFREKEGSPEMEKLGQLRSKVLEQSRKGRCTADTYRDMSGLGRVVQERLLAMIDSRFPVTVEDVVAMGLPCSMKLFHRVTAEERELIGDTIETVGLTDKRNSPIGALSGGQLQRALLGRAIISSPEMLVLDEPLSYIDKAFEHHLYDIIANIAKHTTIILVSHELTVISQMANRHVIVDKTLHECHAHHHYVPSECE